MVVISEMIFGWEANMRKAIALILGLTMLTGCQVTVYSNTVVKHYPSRTQEMFPRGKPVFSCTTVAALYEYLENGGVSYGCVYRQMTAARYRGDFYTYEGNRYRIFEFQEDFWTYYTFRERFIRY